MTQQDFPILCMSRLKLIENGKYFGCQYKDIQYLDISWMSRPTLSDLEILKQRLNETGRYAGCLDRDQL